jgi:hypothetical protein
MLTRGTEWEWCRNSRTYYSQRPGVEGRNGGSRTTDIEAEGIIGCWGLPRLQERCTRKSLQLLTDNKPLAWGCLFERKMGRAQSAHLQGVILVGKSWQPCNKLHILASCHGQPKLNLPRQPKLTFISPLIFSKLFSCLRSCKSTRACRLGPDLY